MKYSTQKVRNIISLKEKNIYFIEIIQKQMNYPILFLVLNIAIALACQLGCITCDQTTTICLQCQIPFPFKMSDGSCTDLDPSIQIPYCYIYTSGIYSGNPLLCDTCMQNYRLQDGSCSYDDTGCIDYDQNGNCTFCAYNLILSSGICVGTFNCKNYSSKYGVVSPCLVCQPGFTLTRNICKVSVGCFIYNSNGGCNICNAGFFQSGFNCVATASLPPTFVDPAQKQKCLVFTPLGDCNFCNKGLEIDNKQSCNFKNAGQISLVHRVATTYYSNWSIKPYYYYF